MMEHSTVILAVIINSGTICHLQEFIDLLCHCVCFENYSSAREPNGWKKVFEIMQPFCESENLQLLGG